MKMIFQVDGGDLKGIMPAYLLKCIEQKIGKSINSIVNLYSGTSTGAVIVGGLAGGMTAEQIFDFYTGRVVDGFRNRQKHWYNPVSWPKPVFSYKYFRSLLDEALGNQLLGDVKVPVTMTSFGLRKEETHFIKSWDKYDAKHKLADVVSWSALSAAHYFGKIDAPNYLWDERDVEGKVIERSGECFQDGGQGTNNCTVMYSMVELLAGHFGYDDEIVIVSLGCGHHSKTKPYNTVSKTNSLKQALSFPFQARGESTPLQVGAARYVASRNPNITFIRLDAELPEEALKFGEFKYVDLYYEAAKKLEKKIPYEYLL
jgi:patatin-like phospholipase/acyl hydrolase